MARFQIVLQEHDFHALRELAGQEYRDPRQQAALLVSEALKRRGLLDAPSKQKSEKVDAGEKPEK